MLWAFCASLHLLVVHTHTRNKKKCNLYMGEMFNSILLSNHHWMFIVQCTYLFIDLNFIRLSLLGCYPSNYRNNIFVVIYAVNRWRKRKNKAIIIWVSRYVSIFAIKNWIWCSRWQNHLVFASFHQRNAISQKRKTKIACHIWMANNCGLNELKQQTAVCNCTQWFSFIYLDNCVLSCLLFFSFISSPCFLHLLRSFHFQYLQIHAVKQLVR